jgi:hypothetical protein
MLDNVLGGGLAALVEINPGNWIKIPARRKHRPK